MALQRTTGSLVRGALAAAALLGIPGTPARAQGGFPAWVGLHHPADLGRLENENRLGELCPDGTAPRTCVGEALRPAVSTFPLFERPDESSARVGELIVVAVPGRGLASYFRPEGAPHGIPFTPDLFLEDWGYGPYLHQTVAERRGEWFLLPPDPWKAAVWMRRGGADDPPSVVEVGAGDLIELDGLGWLVVAAEADALLVRPEQPGDMWCQEGDPPPTDPVEPERRERAELLDARGHLRFRPRYLKGC
jgi:hypothetical protein